MEIDTTHRIVSKEVKNEVNKSATTK